jgi:hypothetical protein
VAAVVGNNSHLIAEVASLYLRPGMVVADVTFGKGVFWQKVDTTKFDFRPTDLCHDDPKKRFDFRQLPYESGTVDVVALDPPYMHRPERLLSGDPYRQTLDRRYRSHLTTGYTHADIMRLYRVGMAEACRVLRPRGGQVWVKCKNEVESGRSCWSIVELYQAAEGLGMFGRDLFTLLPTAWRARRPRHGKQRHARKWCSYLWVFERP